MNLHKVRKDETLNDLSHLYSVDENVLLDANDNEKPVCDMDYIIPVTDGFYYFLKSEEKILDILQKYNITMEEFMRKNKEVLKFKDGTIRVFVPLINKKKKIKVSSIVSLSLKSDIFIESDLESEYINELYGIFDKENKDFLSYVKKGEYINNLNTGVIIDKIDTNDLNFILGENFTDIILNVKLNHKKKILNVIKILKSKGIRVSYLSDHFCEKDTDFINENFDDIILLPTDFDIKVDLRMDEYNLFLQRAELFLKEKTIVGINLNGNKDLKETYKILNEIYKRDFYGICLYMCSNRKLYMKHIISHFFNIK